MSPLIAALEGESEHYLEPTQYELIRSGWYYFTARDAPAGTPGIEQEFKIKGDVALEENKIPSFSDTKERDSFIAILEHVQKEQDVLDVYLLARRIVLRLQSIFQSFEEKLEIGLAGLVRQFQEDLERFLRDKLPILRTE